MCSPQQHQSGPCLLRKHQFTSTVSTDTSIHEQQQTYEMGITNDLGFVLKHLHSLQMLRDTDF